MIADGLNIETVLPIQPDAHNRSKTFPPLFSTAVLSPTFLQTYYQILLSDTSRLPSHVKNIDAYAPFLRVLLNLAGVLRLT